MSTWEFFFFIKSSTISSLCAKNICPQGFFKYRQQSRFMLPVVEFNTSLSKCRKYLLLLSLLFSFTFRIFEMFRSSQMFAENTFNFHRSFIAKKIVYLPFYISVAFEQIQRFQNDKPCFKKRMTLEQATRTEGSVSNLYLEWNAHHDCSLPSTAIKAHQAAEPCPPLLKKRRVISLNFHELFLVEEFVLLKKWD